LIEGSGVGEYDYMKIETNVSRSFIVAIRGAICRWWWWWWRWIWW